MPTDDLRTDLIQALDPVLFAQSVGFTPDDWQQKALRYPGKRLLLLCSRQSGKSTCAALKALHRAIYRPGSLVLLVSPSLRQSSELFRRVTDLSKRVKALPRKTEDNRLSLTFDSGSRVVSLPSREETIRGFSGVDLIIEDEAARVDDDLYRSVRPMLAVNSGALVLLSTPFGKRGHFFEEYLNAGGTWTRIKITAGECPRIPEAFLDEEKQALGERWYRQEYECSFEDTIDAVFNFEEIAAAFDDGIQEWAV